MAKRKALQDYTGFYNWIENIADMRGWDVNEMLNDSTYNYNYYEERKYRK